MATNRSRAPKFKTPEISLHSEHNWRLNNSLQFMMADGDCSKSEAVVAESERVCHETQHTTDKHKNLVERKFDQRISDVNHWRQEGDKCIAKLQDALDKLTNFKLRLMQAKESCKEPIMVCRKACMERDRRLATDLVNDKPHRVLQKYLASLEEATELFERTVEDIEDQMISDRAAKQTLLRDVTDKQAALEIDTHASSCRPENTTSKGFKFDPFLLCSEKNALTMAEWERITRHKIEKAEQELKNSRMFTPLVEEILRRTYLSLTGHRSSVLDAFREHILDQSEAKKKLEERLARVQKQILDVEDILLKLDQSVERKLPSLELASNRMEERRRRPRHELCWDEVDTELEEEVRQLSVSIHQLRSQSSEAKEVLRRLEQTKLSLQKEIEVKKNSLCIDQDCVSAFTNITHISH